VKTAETLLTNFLAAIFIGWSENITRSVIITATAVFASVAVIALS
jgi:hypothetical protein